MPAATVLRSILHHADIPKGQDGRLNYFEATEAVIVVGDLAAVHKVVQLGFVPKDGGVYVQAPYFGKREGIISAVTRDPSHTGTKETHNLMTSGKLALDHFKLSHHANGFVHFSRSGWEKTEVSRQSFRLGDQHGLICQLTLGPVSAFTQAETTDRKKGRLYLPFIFSDKIPDFLTITIEWKEKAALQNLLPGTDSYGPFVSRGDVNQFFLGQPAKYPQQSHVIEVQCGRAEGLSGTLDPFVTLLGGFDAAHAERGDARLGTGFLALLYPIQDPAVAAQQVPTVRRRGEPGPKK